MEKQQKIKRLSVSIFMATAALFVAFFMYLGVNENITIFSPRYSPYYGKIINLSPVIIKDDAAPMGTRTVYSWQMDAHCETGDYLCFYISDNHVDVTIAGELVYSLHSSEEDPVGRSVSSNWCIIPLEPEDAGKRFTIQLTPLITEIIPEEVEFLIGSNYNIILGQLRNDAPQLILAVMCIALGLIIFLVQCYLQVFSGTSQWDQIFMGVFSIILGIWRMTGVRSAPLIFSGNPKLLGYISIGMLFLASPALIQFISIHFQEKLAWKTHILAIVISGISIFVLFSQMLGRADMGESRILSYAALCVGMIMVVIASIYGGRSGGTAKTQLNWKLLPLLAIGIALDFLVYYYRRSSSNLINTCLFFVIFLSITFVASFRETSKMVYRDARTGLFNKSRWNELMQADTKTGERIGIMVLDMNGLKKVNDMFGHNAGDRAICAFADILRSALPSSCVICRWGGDEFAVMIPGINRAKMEKYKDAIYQTAEEYNNSAPEVELYYSVGEALADDYPGCTRSELFIIADENMYENKRRWYAEKRAME